MDQIKIKQRITKLRFENSIRFNKWIHLNRKVTYELSKKIIIR